MISPSETILLLFVGMLLFGSGLPDVGRTLGRLIGELRRGLRDLRDDIGGSL